MKLADLLFKHPFSPERPCLPIKCTGTLLENTWKSGIPTRKLQLPACIGTLQGWRVFCGIAAGSSTRSLQEFSMGLLQDASVANTTCQGIKSFPTTRDFNATELPTTLYSTYSPINWFIWTVGQFANKVSLLKSPSHGDDSPCSVWWWF